MKFIQILLIVEHGFSLQDQFLAEFCPFLHLKCPMLQGIALIFAH